jgi:hypothetical protein
MAAATGKARIIYKREGCSQTFCVNHLAEHHQTLAKPSNISIQKDSSSLYKINMNLYL